MKKIINWKQQRNGQISNESSPEKRSASTWHPNHQLNAQQLLSDHNPKDEINNSSSTAGGGGSILAAAAHSHDLRLRSTALTPPSSAVNQNATSPSLSKFTLPRVGENSPNSCAKSVYTFDDEDDDGHDDLKTLFANKRPVGNWSNSSIGSISLDGITSHSTDHSASIPADSRKNSNHLSYESSSNCDGTAHLRSTDKSPTPADNEMVNGIKNDSADESDVNVDDLMEEHVVDGFAILTFSCQEEMELWVEKKTPKPKEEDFSNIFPSSALIRPKARRARTLPIPCSGAIDKTASHCISLVSGGVGSESVNGGKHSLLTQTSSPCSVVGPSLSTSNSVLSTPMPVSGASGNTCINNGSDNKSVNFSGSSASFRQVQRSTHNRFLHSQQQLPTHQSPPPPPPPSAAASCGSGEHLRRTPDHGPLHEAVTRLLMESVGSMDGRHDFDHSNLNSKSSPSPTSDYQQQLSLLALHNSSTTAQRNFTQVDALPPNSKDSDVKSLSATKLSPSTTPLRPPPPLLEASKAHGVHSLGAASISSTSAVQALPPLQRFPPPPLDIPSQSIEASRSLKRTESVDSSGPLTGGSGSKLSPPKLSPVKPVITPTLGSASLPPPLLFSGRGSNGASSAQHQSPVLNTSKETPSDMSSDTSDGVNNKPQMKLEDDPSVQRSRGMHFLGVVEAAHSALSAAAQLPNSHMNTNVKSVEDPSYTKSQNRTIGSSSRSVESQSSVNASTTVATSDFSISKSSTSISGDGRCSTSRHQSESNTSNSSIAALSVSSLPPNFSVADLTQTSNDRTLRHPPNTLKSSNNSYPSLSGGCSTTSASCYPSHAHHHNQQVSASASVKRRSSPTPNFSQQFPGDSSETKRHRSGGSGCCTNQCSTNSQPPTPFLPPPPTRTTSASVGTPCPSIPVLSIGSGVSNVSNQRALSAGPSSNSMFTSVHPTVSSIDSTSHQQAMAAAAAAGMLPNSGRFSNPATAAAAVAAVVAASSGHGAAAHAPGQSLHDAKSLQVLQMIGGGSAPGGPVSAHDLLHAEQYIASLQHQRQSQQSSPVASYPTAARARSGGSTGSSNEYNSLAAGLMAFSSQQQQQSQQPQHQQTHQHHAQQQQFYEKFKYDPLCRQMMANFSSASGYPPISISALPSASHNAFVGVNTNSSVGMGSHGAFQPKNGYFSQGSGSGSSTRSAYSGLSTPQQASSYLQHQAATAHSSHGRQHSHHAQQHLPISPHNLQQHQQQQSQAPRHSINISPHHQSELCYPSSAGESHGMARRHLRPSSANTFQMTGSAVGGGTAASHSGGSLNVSACGDGKSLPQNAHHPHHHHLSNAASAVKSQPTSGCETKPGYRTPSSANQPSPNSQASSGNISGVSTGASTQRRPSLWCSMHVKIAWYVHQLRQSRHQAPVQSSRPEPSSSSSSSSSSQQPQLPILPHLPTATALSKPHKPAPPPSTPQTPQPGAPSPLAPGMNGSTIVGSAFPPPPHHVSAATQQRLLLQHHRFAPHPSQDPWARHAAMAAAMAQQQRIAAASLQPTYHHAQTHRPHHPWLQALPAAPPHPLSHSATAPHHQQPWSYHFEQLKNAARTGGGTSEEPASKRSRVTSGTSRLAEERDREQWERKRKLHVHVDSQRKHHQQQIVNKQHHTSHSIAHLQSAMSSKVPNFNNSAPHHYNTPSASTGIVNTVTAAVVSVPGPVAPASESKRDKYSDVLARGNSRHTNKKIDSDLEIIENPSDIQKILSAQNSTSSPIMKSMDHRDETDNNSNSKSKTGNFSKMHQSSAPSHVNEMKKQSPTSCAQNVEPLPFHANSDNGHDITNRETKDSEHFKVTLRESPHHESVTPYRDGDGKSTPVQQSIRENSMNTGSWKANLENTVTSQLTKENPVEAKSIVTEKITSIKNATDNSLAASPNDQNNCTVPYSRVNNSSSNEVCNSDNNDNLSMTIESNVIPNQSKDSVNSFENHVSLPTSTVINECIEEVTEKRSLGSPNNSTEVTVLLTKGGNDVNTPSGNNDTSVSPCH